MISKPDPGEYDPFYAAYIARADRPDLLRFLEDQPPAVRTLCSTLGDDDALHRYLPGKWSVKEVLGHVSDTERIFSCRALRIARGDTTPLPGFDQAAYVASTNFDSRSVASLVDEFAAVRYASIALLRSIGPDEWEQRGIANGSPVSVRALAYIMAGHVQHHLEILVDRYGLGGRMP